MTELPLTGVKVLDFSTLLPGPLAGLLLAWLWIVRLMHVHLQQRDAAERERDRLQARLQDRTRAVEELVE